jgi:hypothetical protein
MRVGGEGRVERRGLGWKRRKWKWEWEWCVSGRWE